MQDHVFWRAISSTTHTLKQAYRRNLPQNQQYRIVGTLIGSFIFGILYFGEGTLTGFFLKSLFLFFGLNVLGFFLREMRIKKTEERFRKKVTEVPKIIARADMLKVRSPCPKNERELVLLTNEEAYNQVMQDFDRLKGTLQPKIREELKSSYQIKTKIDESMEKREEAKRAIYHMLHSQIFQVQPEVEKWLIEKASTVTQSMQERRNWLVQALDDLQVQKTAVQRGVEGERKVLRFLEDFRETTLPLPGVRFQSEKGTVENDILLFTPQGIFSLEIKNIGAYGDKRIKVTNDGMWYEWVNNKWKRSDKTKIFDQVNRHTALTEELLFNEFGNDEKYYIKSLIVIPNNNVEIINESSFSIIRENQLIERIREHSVMLSYEERVELRTFIQKQDIGQGQFEFIDSTVLVDDILEVYKQFEIEFQFMTDIIKVYRAYADNLNQDELFQYQQLKQRNMKMERGVL